MWSAHTRPISSRISPARITRSRQTSMLHTDCLDMHGC
ncbi:hypothetical protein PROPHIGD13-2_35 [Mycobacterium phage prophiGD13-2]|nr:hypothetical protein PROPHIGD13-2_35 [Mycobacterium phage prophiGD13-2]